MEQRLWGCALAAALSLAAGCATSYVVKPPVPVYPNTATTNTVDNLHGVDVPDPYRWLEDDNSAATKAWVQAQNQATYGYLEKLPQRGPLKNRLTEIINFERYAAPYKQGSRYFFSKNNGLQNQSVLYTATSLEGDAAVLLDPNTLSTDGTTALKQFAISDDGSKIAYGLSVAGSDWEEWRFRDVATATDTGDKLDWVKFSGAAWSKDGKGLFYSRYDAPSDGSRLTKINENQKLYYHALGTPQSEDRLVYARPDHPKWGFGGQVTDDGRHLIISVREGTNTKNRVYYKDLASDEPVVELLNDFDAGYHFVDNDGGVFFFQTDLDAPRSRIIAIDIRNPAKANWKTVVPQSDATLTGASLVGGRFVLNYLRDAHSEIRLSNIDGTPAGDIAMPGIGSAAGFGGKRADSETFYTFTSFASPSRVYRHDFASGKSEVWKAPKLAFNPDDFAVTQVFYTSKDGTRVPMFLAHKKGVTPNGKRPVLLYAYGGFNISLTPSFSEGNLTWMEMGGVYAQPNLRGGGEYGESWHQAGTKLQKQNVFDDFIAAAEWLIRQGWTRPDHLAISGGSNGGLLVGACMTQRPDLYGACLPAVGVMDMLRFQKFTIGWAWTSDYGSSDNAEEFRALYAYSPYHNLRPGRCYPPTLVTTGDHDDRVVPAHSFKFAARLQACQSCAIPTLIRIETNAGHGAGKPTGKRLEEAADKLAFVAAQFGMSAPEPGR
jgi:prolyl oligopeptidase